MCVVFEEKGESHHAKRLAGATELLTDGRIYLRRHLINT